MGYARLGLVLVALLLSSACAGQRLASPPAGPATGAPSAPSAPPAAKLPAAAPRAPTPAQPSLGYEETGEASWYGNPYHGRRAASGEIYDMNQMTAAHRTLPFDTRVWVESLVDGSGVELRINDRGPFKDPERRIIDVSYAAARLLGVLGPGVIPVRLRVVALPGATRSGSPPATAQPPAGRYAGSRRVVPPASPLPTASADVGPPGRAPLSESSPPSRAARDAGVQCGGFVHRRQPGAAGGRRGAARAAPAPREAAAPPRQAAPCSARSRPARVRLPPLHAKAAPRRARLPPPREPPGAARGRPHSTRGCPAPRSRRRDAGRSLDAAAAAHSDRGSRAMAVRDDLRARLAREAVRRATWGPAGVAGARRPLSDTPRRRGGRAAAAAAGHRPSSWRPPPRSVAPVTMRRTPEARRPPGAGWGSKTTGSPSRGGGPDHCPPRSV